MGKIIRGHIFTALFTTTAVAILGGFGEQIGDAVNGLITQSGICGAENYLCKMIVYILSFVIFICIGILIDYCISKWKIYPNLKFTVLDLGKAFKNNKRYVSILVENNQDYDIEKFYGEIR